MIATIAIAATAIPPSHFQNWWRWQQILQTQLRCVTSLMLPNIRRHLSFMNSTWINQSVMNLNRHQTNPKWQQLVWSFIDKNENWSTCTKHQPSLSVPFANEFVFDFFFSNILTHKRAYRQGYIYIISSYEQMYSFRNEMKWNDFRLLLK